MSRETVVAERVARWSDVLFNHGYILEESSRLGMLPKQGAFALRARRRDALGVPAVVVDIVEVWNDGSDPHSLGLEAHGCHLEYAGWNAQIQNGAVGQERLDVDRRKPVGQMIHRHPFGHPNAKREPASSKAPESWIQHVERLSAELFFAQDEAD
ncbi:MAG: hypothetical protein ACSLFR_18615 [Solirubrobacteraceae bacterium]